MDPVILGFVLDGDHVGPFPSAIESRILPGSRNKGYNKYYTAQNLQGAEKQESQILRQL